MESRVDDIVLFKVHMPKSVDQPLLEVLHSGFVGQGPKVDEFERQLSEYLGNRYCLTLNSGTSGLQLALRLAGVGAGDEVITTAMTCTATNMPILAAGARIVWADVDPVTGLIDPEDIERKITPKTRAIIMVHYGGMPCDLERINQIAKQYSLKTIEDAAHALGAEYQGEKIGNHSDFVVFSFQAIKHISTVDGGLLVCRDEEDYRRGKLLRWYGIDREQSRKDYRCEEDIREYGYKFHMNDIAATIGIEQLKYLDGIVTRHIENQYFYDEALSRIDGVRLVPKQGPLKSSSWLYTLHVERRDHFIEWMREEGVMVSCVHARNDRHTAFADSVAELPQLDRFCATQISIPVGWWITDRDRSYIADKIREFVRIQR